MLNCFKNKGREVSTDDSVAKSTGYPSQGSGFIPSAHMMSQSSLTTVLRDSIPFSDLPGNHRGGTCIFVQSELLCT